jgi:hypothetical protein
MPYFKYTYPVSSSQMGMSQYTGSICSEVAQMIALVKVIAGGSPQ